VIEHDKRHSRFRPGEGISRVGLFGGTFDPVHIGHLHIAEEVKDAFGIGRMIVIPSAVPPHKHMKRVSDARDRLAMARMCFEGHEDFQVSDVELSRKGPSYTIDTIRYFLTEFPQPVEVLLAIGSDSFFEIHTWHDYHGIFQHVPVIVMRRPGFSGRMIENAGQYLSEHVASGYDWHEGLGAFIHETCRPVYFFDVTPHDISSTEIRNRVKTGTTISGLVLKEVEDYIRTKGLYT
jgi:nicotinate-nucleotide adenylyltransferase